MTPRLEPIEKPHEPEIPSAYRMIPQEFGKVSTPVKVVTARMPGSLEVTRKLQKFHEGIQLGPELKLMVGAFTSEIHGCGFCVDLAQSATQMDHEE